MSFNTNLFINFGDLILKTERIHQNPLKAKHLLLLLEFRKMYSRRQVLRSIRQYQLSNKYLGNIKNKNKIQWFRSSIAAVEPHGTYIEFTRLSLSFASLLCRRYGVLHEKLLTIYYSNDLSRKEKKTFFKSSF